MLTSDKTGGIGRRPSWGSCGLLCLATGQSVHAMTAQAARPQTRGNGAGKRDPCRHSGGGHGGTGSLLEELEKKLSLASPRLSASIRRWPSSTMAASVLCSLA